MEQIMDQIMDPSYMCVCTCVCVLYNGTLYIHVYICWVSNKLTSAMQCIIGDGERKQAN